MCFACCSNFMNLSINKSVKFLFLQWNDKKACNDWSFFPCSLSHCALMCVCRLSWKKWKILSLGEMSGKLWQARGNAEFSVSFFGDSLSMGSDSIIFKNSITSNHSLAALLISSNCLWQWNLKHRKYYCSVFCVFFIRFTRRYYWGNLRESKCKTLEFSVFCIVIFFLSTFVCTCTDCSEKQQINF